MTNEIRMTKKPTKSASPSTAVHLSMGVTSLVRLEESDRLTIGCLTAHVKTHITNLEIKVASNDISDLPSAIVPGIDLTTTNN